MPLPGVSIQVKNSSSLGAVTNFDGEFSIFLPSDQDNVLVFSYVGFYSQEVDVSLVDNVNISMETDTTELEEVVVVGYGTVLKKDLTGSVASVKVDETSARQANTVDNLLQGRVAGVQVTGNLANPFSSIFLICCSAKIKRSSLCTGSANLKFLIPLCLKPRRSPKPLNFISSSDISKPSLEFFNIFILFFALMLKFDLNNKMQVACLDPLPTLPLS